MIKNTKKIIMAISVTLIISLFSSYSQAESLYEFYTNSTKESLNTETQEMGKKLKNVFNERSINSEQRKIDFSQYYSSLQKLIVYASKLATYSNYETDLRFAKDKEIFKGLPEDTDKKMDQNLKPDIKDFASKKYTRMKTNVEDEIQTYEDLILLALDSCESLAGNDLSGFTRDESNREKILDFMRSDMYMDYVKKQPRFAQRWSNLNSRLSYQFSLWEETPLSPDSPIIDPAVTGAI